MFDQKDFLQKIKFAVLSVDDKAELILYGSRARGDNKEDSDWDILVLTDEEIDKSRKSNIRHKVFGLELEYAQAVSAMFIDRRQWNKLSITGFYENVTNEGRVL
jgi:predicted nucleotidyltransferase